MDEDGRGSVSFLLQRVADLIHFNAGGLEGAVAILGRLDEVFREANTLKALGLTRSGVSDTFSVLLYHLIRSRQYVRRNRQAYLLGRLQIDHELKLPKLEAPVRPRSPATVCGPTRHKMLALPHSF
jgi:hypothetical protein